MKYSLITLALLLLPAISVAEQMQIPIYKRDQACEQGCPTRGMTMAVVEKRFGEPEERGAAVGEPPISRWFYKDFIVYFERNRVLHVVASH